VFWKVGKLFLSCSRALSSVVNFLTPVSFTDEEVSNPTTKNVSKLTSEVLSDTPLSHFKVYYNDVATSTNAVLVDSILFVDPEALLCSLHVEYEYDEDTRVLRVLGKFTHTVGTSYVTLENGAELGNDYYSVVYSSPIRGSDYLTYVIPLRLIAIALELEIMYYAPSTSVLLYSDDYEMPEDD
jgi:hypothetical protein